MVPGPEMEQVQAMVQEPDSERDLEQVKALVQDSAPEQEKERAPGLEQVQARVQAREMVPGQEQAPEMARQLSQFLCPFAFRCRWLYLWPL
jgi:hypothetical protein